MIDSSPEANDRTAVTWGIWIWSGKIHRFGGRQQLCSSRDMGSGSFVLDFDFFLSWYVVILEDKVCSMIVLDHLSICVWSFIKLHVFPQRMISLIYALVQDHFFYEQHVFILVIGPLSHSDIWISCFWLLTWILRYVEMYLRVTPPKWWGGSDRVHIERQNATSFKDM